MAETPTPGLFSALAASVVRRRKVLTAGIVLVGLAWAGHGLWGLVRGSLRGSARYQITVQSVQISHPPYWVREDIRPQAINRASLQGPLSSIDPQRSIPRISEAFRLHPWVKQVNRVEILPPNRAVVEITWRKPAAAAQLSANGATRLLPLDEAAVRLPEQGFADGELRRLPRITPVASAPPLGEAWADPQVTGALDLILRLREDWSRLSLADVLPSARPEIRGEQQFYRFELLTVGGTRIVWGAAPRVQAPDEAPFDRKLARLKQFVLSNRIELDSYRSPKTIDLRYGLRTERRIAKGKDGKRTAQRGSPPVKPDPVVK